MRTGLTRALARPLARPLGGPLAIALGDVGLHARELALELGSSGFIVLGGGELGEQLGPLLLKPGLPRLEVAELGAELGQHIGLLSRDLLGALALRETLAAPAEPHRPEKTDHEHGDYHQRPARPGLALAHANLSIQVHLLLAQASLVLDTSAGLGLFDAQAIVTLALELGHVLGMEPGGLLGGAALGRLALLLLEPLGSQPLRLGGGATRLLLAAHTVGFELPKVG